MAFDDKTRNRLQKFVSDARRVLTEEFTAQLQNDYGLDPVSGNIAPLGSLADDPRKETARLLRQTYEHYLASTPNAKPVEVLDRIVREQAFTILNRLVALRMCEERGLLEESIKHGATSRGFQLYERLAGSALGERAEAYRAYLLGIFDEFTVDLGVLFDRFAPSGLLFPGPKSLDALLTLINAADLEPLWAGDETIGWIYQYFNTQEERQKMRKESAAPRNSRELAVRNQFFTPRYVVEFLVDNTLGRTWIEMMGETQLTSRCRFFVKPLEDDEPRPPRAKKDPRDLKILDPACGSGHFLLYAFDLLLDIYQEAWHDSEAPQSTNTGDTLREKYESEQELHRHVPELILQHNLHGVDIDPRPAQIAQLALWMRAQRAWTDRGVERRERPVITRTNIVVAEPMPGEREMKQELLASLDPKLARVTATVFDRMQLAGDLGVLLRMEHEIRDAMRETYKDFGGLFEREEKAKWIEVEARLFAALSEYGERAEGTSAYSRRLFAGDAARGLALIDISTQRYDVILMNPPFGETSEKSVAYLNSAYAHSFIDVLAAFIERGAELCTGGYLGALTSRACLYTSTLARWRERTFLPSIDVLVDLGAGILDSAMVFTCASVLAVSDAIPDKFKTFDLRRVADRAVALEASVRGEGATTYLTSRRELARMASARVLYNVPPEFLQWKRSSKTLASSGGSARAGSTTYDDWRFIRLTWEVTSDRMGWTRRWVNFSKGGSFETFYNDVHLVVNWETDGREVGEFNRVGYGTDAQSRRASSFYGRPGVTYSRRTVKGFGARALARDCIFADKGPVIFSPPGTDESYALGYWNAAPIRALIHMQVQAGSLETGVVNGVPWKADEPVASAIGGHARQIWRYKADHYRWVETDRLFVPPFLRGFADLESLCIFANARFARNSSQAVEVADYVSDLVSAVWHLPPQDLEDFEVSRDDHAIQDRSYALDAATSGSWLAQLLVGFAYGRFDVRLSTGERTMPPEPEPFDPLPVCSPGMLTGDDGLPLAAPPKDYPIDWPADGLLVDDAGHPRDIVARTQEVLRVVFGERGDEVERELCTILAAKSLRDWLRKPSNFFGDHLARYSKSRRQAPIYWPLSTASGGYTIWLYIHRLTDQTLFLAVNDLVEPKLRETEEVVRQVRGKGAARTKAEERELETLEELANELGAFRDELLRVAAFWKPDLDDGVVITAAPLWKLFRLPKWQKTLKETWQKLERGDYDWAHLAYTIWSDRVREKCRTDKSLAIAHGLEELYVEPPKTANKKGRRKESDELTDGLEFEA